MFEHLSFSEHAITRMAQRRLTPNDVVYVVSHGRHRHCAGLLHVFLGRRDIPRQDRRNQEIARLEGTTVLLDPEKVENVVTVYRNRFALKAINRKSKTNLRKACQ